MLVITFGRAASQELRERVREPSWSRPSARSADDPAGARRAADASPTWSRPAARRRRRRGRAGHRRVRDALAAFDAATIATTHQFCQMVLDSLGVAGDTDTGATLVESLDELVVEVVDDLYLRALRAAPRTHPPSPGEALTIARTRRRRPAGPARAGRRRTDAAGRPPGRRSRARCATRSTGASAGSAILSYDDLLGRLADALADDEAAGRASGCGSAGRSCWSTSSRTPTPCSGRCSTGRSAATRRWC